MPIKQHQEGIILIIQYPTKLYFSLLIRSSAGVGRTGTFLALDYLIKQADIEGVLDVPGCVDKLRHQRTALIQTLVNAQTTCNFKVIFINNHGLLSQQQYIFLHEALVDYFNVGCTTVEVAHLSKYIQDLEHHDGFNKQYKVSHFDIHTISPIHLEPNV